VDTVTEPRHNPIIHAPARAAVALLWSIAAVAALALALAMALPADATSELVLTVLDDPALIVALAAALLARAHTEGTDRRVWTLLALGLGCWLAGELLHEVLELTGGIGGEASMADALYLGFYPLALAALVVLGRAEPGGERRARTLDVVIVMLGSALLMWWVVRDGTLAAGAEPLTRVLDVSYAALDLGLLWLLLLPAFRSDLRWTTGRSLLVAGLVLVLAADAVWMTTHGDVYDLLTSAAMLLLGLAALRDPRLTPAEATEPTPRHRWLGEAAVVGAGAGALALTSTLALTGDLPADIVLGAAAVLALVLARLLLTIVQHEQLLRESERRASTDPLTGLFNHGAFHEHLGRELARARRTGEPLGLLLIDLDDLKAINDVAGHRTGDRVIREVASRLSSWCRTPDIACRIGGDEFALLAPGAGPEALGALAARLNRAVHTVRADSVGDVSVSIGGAVFPDTARTAAELVERADEALYAAKRAGRDGYRQAGTPELEAPVVRLARGGSA
jgi:diguanylate cyclase (GGDEF)-like protein